MESFTSSRNRTGFFTPTGDETEEEFLARVMIGRTVSIRGVGGYLHVESGDNNDVKTGSVNTRCLFVIEQAPNRPNGWITFSPVDGQTNKYLTVNMYGDETKSTVLETLSRNVPSLLPEHIIDIVDYIVDTSTNDDNFEGSGFNYQPMTLQDGPPNLQQVFQLKWNNIHQYHRMGIKTSFGTFWRSQHWKSIISQSPHLEGDETFYFYENDEPLKNFMPRDFSISFKKSDLSVQK